MGGVPEVGMEEFDEGTPKKKNAIINKYFSGQSNGSKRDRVEMDFIYILFRQPGYQRR